MTDSSPDLGWILPPPMRHRADIAEIMDDPHSDPFRLRTTLRQFVVINRLFTRSRYLATTLFGPHIRRSPQREYSLLDIGAGGCDFGLWFEAYCRRLGSRARVTCIDTDPRVLTYAREATASNPAVEIAECPVQNIARLHRRFDFVFANHLLHHLPDSDIPVALERIVEATRLAFVINDLRRSRLSYVLLSLLTIPFFRGGFVRYDGRVSILRGFTPEELRAFVNRAGMGGGISVGSLFPGRVCIVGNSAPETPLHADMEPRRR